MTQLMGILNLTPDSFSGDGIGAGNAAERIERMIAQGADAIDIGAESTRPGAVLLTPEQEWQRLAAVVEMIDPYRSQVRFSLDTRHADTAQKGLAHGFHFINDVSGSLNPLTAEMVKKHQASLILMHSISVPADSAKTLPEGCDPVEVVLQWAQRTIAQATGEGLAKDQIVIDPGIGFGKTKEQSLALIRRISEFKALGVPLLVGHSRKSFLSLFTDKPAEGRDPETLLVSRWLADSNVDYIRVHDLASHRSMLAMREVL